MNAYWKQTLNYKKSLHFPKIKNPVTNINEIVLNKITRKTGRSWRVNDLRIKSDSDIHKLWYVLLKEKLALQSEEYKLAQNTQISKKITTDLNKVKTSMRRVKSIVTERELLRNDFMMFMEFYYIRKKQINENYMIGDITKRSKYDMKIEPMLEGKKQGDNVVIRGELENASEGNLKLNLNDNHNHNEVISGENLNITSNIPTEEGNITSPVTPNNDEITVLNEEEIKQSQKLQKRYKSVNEKLDDYVLSKDRKMLRGREKRKMVANIDSVRSSHAKNIFMKEMAALSYVLSSKGKDSSKNNNNSKSRLENI